MNVSALFHGILADFVGVKTASFELASGSTYGDLLTEIGKRYSQSMPEQLWDQKENRFNAPILAKGTDREIESPEIPLEEGEEIKFFLMISGG
ncbi:MAG: MoaD/ThiS family protein [Deltaproteobacteria bacterium]|nr:MoaD/ThiS family protein [Deltaproteobacteria bacterium]MBW2051166.1 MoaD/ThiS family protein [Deltaproteobacteria bacterium]MBW2140008.1 MoaD/ThiS family protein [Deltaproteobacteria bacterium]MBW2322330.1 MoaD/ThiS family protein [Deltaproteobacteria bacterium]